MKFSILNKPVEGERAEKKASLKTSLFAAALGTLMFCAGGAMAQVSEARGPVWTPVPMPEQVAQTEAMVNVDEGMDLRYWDTGGDGDVVVLLHPATGSADMWGYQQPVLAEAGYRVIAYSRRGYAGSSPTNKELPGVGAEDLAKVLDAAGVETAHLLGAAHGGSFAMDFAVANPDRVKSLTLLSSTLSLREANMAEMNARVRPKEAFAAMTQPMKELSPSYRAGNPEGLALWEELHGKAFPGGMKSWVWPQYTAEMTWEHVQQYDGPMMIVTGDADIYLSPAQMRLQASYFPQAEVYVVDESAHAANWEQPDVFNELFLGFLERTAGS